MPALRIRKIEIQGFRAFGQKAQVLEFPSPITAVWGPNSQGKTSLAEAFEFLLTGKIVRRELMSSTQDEFADALRNAHMPAAMPAFVQAEIVSPDGSKHAIRRALTTDYGKKQDCQTRLEIDGKVAAETDLPALGIVLSQPPLRAPVLAQHTLGYLFTAKPQDRATYFRALLEVTDLETFRGAVAALDQELKAPDDPLIAKFKAVLAIPETQLDFLLVQVGLPTAAELEQAFSGALSTLITAAGEAVPATLPERIASLETILAEKRTKAFPVKSFDKKPLGAWAPPADDHFQKLKIYLVERAKVDEETRRLVALFKEALNLPAVAAASNPFDCPLCATPQSLTPERIALIRQRVQDNDAFHQAEKGAKESLSHISANAQTLPTLIGESLPRFIVDSSKTRRAQGFRIVRIRTLLPKESSPLVDAWCAALRLLIRARTGAVAQARSLITTIAGYIANLETVSNLQPLQDAFSQLPAAFAAFGAALKAYLPAEQAVAAALHAVVDAESNTTGWQELIDLSRDLPGLGAALIEQTAYADAQKELTKALKEIDRGNERVLEDKFQSLSDSVQMWWDLLRPDELSFFSAVRPRPNARRTVDFKAGLSANPDRSDPKLRDVIAVFSQSQLHCLGLALFLARSVQENTGFVVLDDPILSSDEDYRAYFNTAVLEKLLDLDMQVIVLTQDQKSWKDLEHRFLHKNIGMFQISLEQPRDGTSVRNTADDLMAKLAKIENLVRGTHPDLRKLAGEELRNAGERFCKDVLVRDRWGKGDKAAAISDYDGKTLGELGPKVEPLLAKDASHPGKLRAFRDNLNPAKHDDGIPSQGVLKVCLGDLKTLKKEYL